MVETGGTVKGRAPATWMDGFENENFHLLYLTMWLTRLFSVSYTPSCKTSFLRRRTGPSSGSTHGHPLVAPSGSVAARKMAPATRSTGVIGMPTARALDFQSIILVSAGVANDKLVNNDTEMGQGREGQGLVVLKYL